MALSIERMYQCLRNFDFAHLLVEELGWSLPVNKRLMSIDAKHSRLEIARLSGIAVFEINAANEGIPDAQMRDMLYEELIPLFHESLLIFLDKERTQSLWYWRKHEGNESFKHEYVYLRGQPEDLFFKKLDSIQSDLLAPQESRYQRKRRGDRLRPVTNAIVEAFDEQRVWFIQQIEGIENERDCQLYAMILLCRLMFLYFLQRRGFLDQGDIGYLESHLYQEINMGRNYYQKFLLPLCEALSTPVFTRREDSQVDLGSVPYLGGSLFSLHRIESSYVPIHIPDEAFSHVFAFFSRYDWRIVDIVTENQPDIKQPEPAHPEITPDILGAIFETYFNRQSQSSAYATPPEITAYFCRQTVQQFILDKLKLNEGLLLSGAFISFQDFLDLLDQLDATQCSSLLFEILPNLSILDPACGSGTFLLAALDTLLLVYSKLASKVADFHDPEFHNWLSALHAYYPNRMYALKRRIITQNLFGVDIVDEAIELTRFRLYLALVSSLEDIKNLEPLLDINLNLYVGNSLIGFLRWNDIEQASSDIFLMKEYTLFQKRYELLASHRNTLHISEPLQVLKAEMALERLKAEIITYFNQALLKQFQQFQRGYGHRIEMKWGSEARKKATTLKAIEHLRPFHWCGVFGEIMDHRGGFDIIITSPPWEILRSGKSSADFYQDIFYEFAPQYSHQGSLRKDKVTQTTIHTYKLFLEQCYNLLCKNGYCGIIVPKGVCVDDSAGKLRQLLFTQNRVTGVFCFKNRRAILSGVDPDFEFTLLSFVKGQSTSTFPTAFSRQAIEDLEHFPASKAIILSLNFVRRFSPNLLALGKFRDQKDVSISEKMMAFPSLNEKVDGAWNPALSSGIFFSPRSSILLTEPEDEAFPVYEGKMIDQFTCTSAPPRFWVDRKMLVQEEQRRLSPIASAVKRWRQAQEHSYRLVFRSTTSSTNSRTMLATILPPDTFINNTLNFVSSPLEVEELLFLTALLNSFIVDFAIRLRVATHLSLLAVYQVPIPRLTRRDEYFRKIVMRAARLICISEDFKALWESVMQEPWKQENVATNPVERKRLCAELDGLIAYIYDIAEDEFVPILSAFPFVPAPIKVAARNAYQDVKRGLLS